MTSIRKHSVQHTAVKLEVKRRSFEAVSRWMGIQADWQPLLGHWCPLLARKSPMIIQSKTHESNLWSNLTGDLTRAEDKLQEGNHSNNSNAQRMECLAACKLRDTSKF